MSVTLLFGLPRSGKSTFLTYAARRALAGKPIAVGCGLWKRRIGDFQKPRYKRVYCNFPVKGTYKLDFDQLGKVEFRDCLIIIDEIMLLCDSRNWKEYGAELRDFMALHGHYRCDILAASQGWKDCDLRIRNLAERLLYIQRLGPFSRVSPIRKGWHIEETIDESYILGCPLACKFLFRPLLYKHFDSFAAPEMPENPATLW